MKWEMFQKSKPERYNATKDIDPMYLDKVGEIEVEDDMPFMEVAKIISNELEEIADEDIKDLIIFDNSRWSYPQNTTTT